MSSNDPSYQPIERRPGQDAHCDPQLISRLIEVIESDIVPLTTEGVQNGNKIFGAALLKKSDLSVVVAATNKETENPLWHGEIATINAYYRMVNGDESKRVDPKDMIFLSTHEPCTLCSSAITWCGFDNFYYLFSHEESRDSFQIGHDLQILKEVFKHDPGGYARRNKYWTAYSLVDLIENTESKQQDEFEKRLTNVRAIYDRLSSIYQSTKRDNKNIPLG